MNATSSLPVGMMWDEYGRPRFAVEPDLVTIENLIRQYLRVEQTAICSVKFIAEGGINKVYKVEMTVQGHCKSIVMRVALPLDMPYKVLSEVATYSYVQKHTDMPTPRIIAYDATNQNKIRFPWILMEFVPGETLSVRKWTSMSMDKKVKLVQQMALYQSQLFRHEFDSLSSLYPSHGCLSSTSTQTDEQKYSVESLDHTYLPAMNEDDKSDYMGRMVSMDFLRADAGPSRGPFTSEAEFLLASLSTPLRRVERWTRSAAVELDACEDEAAINDPIDGKKASLERAEELLSFIKRLIRLVPELFPEPPLRENYPPINDTSEELKDGVNRFYYNHIRDHEKIKLRELFIDEMEHLRPGFRRLHMEGQQKREFMRLVHSAQAYSIFDTREFQWLDKIENGECTEGVLEYEGGDTDSESEESSSEYDTSDDESDEDEEDADDEDNDEKETDAKNQEVEKEATNKAQKRDDANYRGESKQNGDWIYAQEEHVA